jgi:hypothetical protein
MARVIRRLSYLIRVALQSRQLLHEFWPSGPEACPLVVLVLKGGCADTPPRTNMSSHRAVRTRRPAPRVSWSRVVRIGTAALVIGAGSYWLGKRASQPPAFTPLVDGRVTPSLLHEGRTSAPRMPIPLGPSRGASPAGLRTVGSQSSGRGPVPGAGIPRVPLAIRSDDLWQSERHDDSD